MNVLYFIILINEKICKRKKMLEWEQKNYGDFRF